MLIKYKASILPLNFPFLTSGTIYFTLSYARRINTTVKSQIRDDCQVALKYTCL